MVEKTEEEEEETAAEEEEAGGRFRIAMPFEDAVAALLEVKPEKPPRQGRKKAPPESEAGKGDQP